MQGEAVAFFVRLFWSGGGGRGMGVIRKKREHTEKEKKRHILVYKFNENRDVCITKQNIYFR